MACPSARAVVTGIGRVNNNNNSSNSPHGGPETLTQIYLHSSRKIRLDVKDGGGGIKSASKVMFAEIW